MEPPCGHTEVGYLRQSPHPEHEHRKEARKVPTRIFVRVRRPLHSKQGDVSPFPTTETVALQCYGPRYRLSTGFLTSA